MLRSELLIDASATTVWALTTDVEHLPDLTPTMTEVRRLDAGPLQVGSRARIKQPAQRASVWTVATLEPEREFVWTTKVGTVTMVGGHHLEPAGDGCRNVLTLELRGAGSRLMERLVGRRIAAAIATENAGIKAAAEAASPRTS
jgi:hypothetical protein